MWAEFVRAPNRYIAETWKELLHSEGIAVRLVAPPDRQGEGDFGPCLLYVPDSKTHVAREILRKV
ncbi:MAG: hypothetical protein O6913_07855 [Chloroflexi bacterium]|jgi:hypothetical protein|nr:hypothetical protein [Chloroflexota bacterium]MCZ6706391.1 hypothetical protein [Chloroflexota bacterium]